MNFTEPQNKKHPGNIPGALYVSRETLFTVKLTGDELAPGLAGGLGDDDCKIIAVHEGNDVREIALESGGNGVVFLVAADDGKDGLFCALGVHVSVQRPCVNRDALAVLKVFDVQALCPGKLVHSLFALGEVGDVGVDDVHIYFPFWPVNHQYREAVPDRQALLGLFRHVVDFRVEVAPRGFVQYSEPFPRFLKHCFYFWVCAVAIKKHFKKNRCTLVYGVNTRVEFFKRQFLSLLSLCILPHFSGFVYWQIK